MDSGTAVLNILYGNQQRMYKVIFTEMSCNVWDKFMFDDGIMNFSEILGQFMMQIGGDYFEFSDGRRSELYVHYQQLHELQSTANIAKLKCYSNIFANFCNVLNTSTRRHIHRTP